MSLYENLYENVLTGLILLALFVLVYCKLTNKTIGDVIREVKDILHGGTEEVQEVNL